MYLTHAKQYNFEALARTNQRTCDYENVDGLRNYIVMS